MGYPRHIGHTDDDWTEYLDNVEDVLRNYLTDVLSMSQTRTALSNLSFSVGQKAYLAGYESAMEEVREATKKEKSRGFRV